MRQMNILIWGTGERAQFAFNILLKCDMSYDVIAFGDNNIQMQGQYFLNKKVYAKEDLKELKPDAIVIASSASAQIRLQLADEGIPIYNSVQEMFIKRIAIDISGCCNAKCKWCVTGLKNRNSNVIHRKFMKFDEFKQVYLHLLEKRIISQYTEIMLYSWGEPLLNPDYNKIIMFLAENKQKFSMSTNASIAPSIESEDAYKYCSSFTFSMPGFSQESYDLIHGFSFELIKNNIKKMVSNIYKCGFQGKGTISYHAYKFNIKEMQEAKEFAEKVGLKFDSYYPYFNGASLALKYLKHEMDIKVLQEAEEDLTLSFVKDLQKERPKGFKCVLEDIITVDFQGNLVLCCAADEEVADYQWGTIFEIQSYEDWLNKRKKCFHVVHVQNAERQG